MMFYEAILQFNVFGLKSILKWGTKDLWTYIDS